MCQFKLGHLIRGSFVMKTSQKQDTCCSDTAKRRNDRLLNIFIVPTNNFHVCTLILLDSCVSFVTDYYFELCSFES